MIENTLLTKLNKKFDGSPLVKLFLLLIFQQTFDPLLEIDRNSNLKNYGTDCEYESLIYHNGSLKQEDHKYLYNTILKFEQQTTPDEKERIVFLLLDSQVALEIITEEFDNDPENYDEDGSYTADDKEIFNTTQGY